MSLFATAFKNIGNAVENISSLDVITFKGTVKITSTTELDDFDKVLTAARSNSDVDLKLLASTRVKLDGDVTVFYDQDISDAEVASHEKLVSEAAENRRETVLMIKDILGDAVKDL